jgi:hypothetical protein
VIPPRATCPPPYHHDWRLGPVSLCMSPARPAPHYETTIVCARCGTSRVMESPTPAPSLQTIDGLRNYAVAAFTVDPAAGPTGDLDDAIHGPDEEDPA